jgi:dTDP-4-dehydrorhamnose reductase
MLPYYIHNLGNLHKETRCDVQQKIKILLTGASGLIGSYLLTQIQEDHAYDIYVLVHKSTPKFGNIIQADLSHVENLSKKLAEIRPDLIVNLAALTNVDICEIQRDLAICLNRDLVAAISKYINDNGKNLYFLHVSTDYVFDGAEGNYKEDSQPNPVNLYGLTKLQGENEIISRLIEGNWCIARTSTPFGVHPKKQTFPVFLLEKLRKGQSVKVVIDQYTSPTYAMDLAKMFKEIIDRRIKGIIHTSGTSRLSRYEQALKITREFGLNEQLILKARSEDMNWKAQRPNDSSLDVNKACKLLIQNKPKSFDDALAEFAKEERDGHPYNLLT